VGGGARRGRDEGGGETRAGTQNSDRSECVFDRSIERFFHARARARSRRLCRTLSAPPTRTVDADVQPHRPAGLEWAHRPVRGSRRRRSARWRRPLLRLFAALHAGCGGEDIHKHAAQRALRLRRAQPVCHCLALARACPTPVHSADSARSEMFALVPLLDRWFSELEAAAQARRGLAEVKCHWRSLARRLSGG